MKEMFEVLGVILFVTFLIFAVPYCIVKWMDSGKISFDTQFQKCAVICNNEVQSLEAFSSTKCVCKNGTSFTWVN